MGQVKWTKFEPKSSELLTLHDKLSIIDILKDFNSTEKSRVERFITTIKILKSREN